MIDPKVPGTAKAEIPMNINVKTKIRRHVKYITNTIRISYVKPKIFLKF